MSIVSKRPNKASEFVTTTCEGQQGDQGAGVVTLRLRGAIGKTDAISVKQVLPIIDQARSARRLHLVIDSEGGKVDEAEAIYALLRSIPVPISAEVNMKCWSAAIMLLLAADFRWARHNASLLIHRTRAIPRDVLGDNYVTAPQLIDQAQKLYASDEREVEFLAIRTGYSRAWFAREQSNEDLLRDDAALRCGLLHAIEGRDPFTMENLALFDRLTTEAPLPSECLLANYRAAERVAAMPGASHA
ncbi:ATP-dependent Clp protease proteolytic subunit [Tardiphaga sp. 285_C5_N1_2]|uniref:ATP-dependent Clp protease proteolytic subunit n=1 Tax=Tardiphaga sp. 285_C5_N1_2 TaxID=3240775 RepID=UPI003F8AB0BD